jgi:hypothetical protein
MATKVKAKQREKKQNRELFNISLTMTNYTIIGIGIILIIIGYIFMAEKSVSGFMPTVVAPILLVLGYCVLIPVGILIKSNFLQKKSDAINISDKK